MKKITKIMVTGVAVAGVVVIAELAYRAYCDMFLGGCCCCEEDFFENTNKAGDEKRIDEDDFEDD